MAHKGSLFEIKFLKIYLFGTNFVKKLPLSKTKNDGINDDLKVIRQEGKINHRCHTISNSSK